MKINNETIVLCNEENQMIDLYSEKNMSDTTYTFDENEFNFIIEMLKNEIETVIDNVFSFRYFNEE